MRMALRRGRARVAGTLAVMCVFAGAVQASQIHVPADFGTIQAAIDAATDGDEIIVAPGTHLGMINFQGKALEVRSSAGAASTLLLRFFGTGSVVTFDSGEGRGTVLDGFTIALGNGTLLQSDQWGPAPVGGGMLIHSSSPTVRNCVFEQNSATFGGGLLNFNSSPLIENCTFTLNESGQGGAGMANVNSAPTIVNCHFESNIATVSGGGMHNEQGSAPSVVDSTFRNNVAFVGGGMYSISSEITVTGSLIQQNTADWEGGGMWSESTNAHISKTTFEGNQVGLDLMSGNGRGGGMHIHVDGQTTIDDCIFRDNASVYEGGGLSNLKGSVTIANSRFESNSSLVEGGAIFVHHVAGSAEIADTLFCENQPDAITGLWDDLGGNQFIAECSITGDLNDDGVVNVFDLLILLAAWGPCADPNHCPADLDGSGAVDVFDLLLLLANWG